MDVSSISEGGRYADAGSKDDDTAAQGLERALARLEALEAQVAESGRLRLSGAACAKRQTNWRVWVIGGTPGIAAESRLYRGCN